MKWTTLEDELLEEEILGTQPAEVPLQPHVSRYYVPLPRGREGEELRRRFEDRFVHLDMRTGKVSDSPTVPGDDETRSSDPATDYP
ncbi:hypothetical protein BON30_45910 [Cystobacter ferrugineus]|uniref:Uncharacterized protein n=1 Tax=Cystobacter ferrugineus TaxID=83449 RepID=A0A1L9AVH0_9BACT|nr:hypothetical protein BON30_45910 [Cystobacter ferrugineus]